MSASERRPRPLDKNLSRRDVFLFLVCTLVGLDTLGSVASRGGEGFFWLVVLAVSFFLPYGLLTAELGAAFPEEGGAYLWTKHALGRDAAGIIAVFYWVSNPIWLGGALTITAIATWSSFFFELGEVAKYVFGGVLIWTAVLSAILSFRIGKWVTAFGAWARVALLSFFTVSVAIFGLKHGVRGIHLHEAAPTREGFFAVAPLLFFNFVGFELPSAAGDEMVDPRRDVPRAVLRAGAAAVLSYGVPILAILLVVPTDRITGLKGFVDAMRTVFTVYGGHVARAADGSETVVLEGAGKILGCGCAIGFIVALATSGTSWIMGADRSQAVACLDGAGPRVLGSFANRHGTPVTVNVASGVVATAVMFAAFAVTGASAEKFFAASLSLGISTTAISYLGIFPALAILRRRRPDAQRPYRVPGGHAGATAVSALTFGWALFATLCLVWPGLGLHDADSALPAAFVTRDAYGAVIASDRLLFELTQLVPLVMFGALGVLFLALGRYEAAVGAHQVGRLTRTPSIPPATGAA